MKIKKTSTNPRNKILIVAALLLVAAALIAGIAWQKNHENNPRPVNDVDYSAPSNEEVDAGEQASEQLEQPTDTAQTSDTSSEQQLDADNLQQPRDNDSKISITMASVEDDQLTIRTLIRDGASSGKCTITMKRNGVTQHQETVGVQMVASNYTCMGFDINVGSMSRGTYDLTVTYLSGTSTHSAGQAISI